MSKLFSPESIAEMLDVLKTEVPFATFETLYVTILSTAFALLIGLPLGVLLVVGERNGVFPLPAWLAPDRARAARRAWRAAAW